MSGQLRSDLELLVRTACTDLIRRWKRTNADLREQQDLLRHSLASLQVHTIVILSHIYILSGI